MSPDGGRGLASSACPMRMSRDEIRKPIRTLLSCRDGRWVPCRRWRRCDDHCPAAEFQGARGDYSGASGMASTGTGRLRLVQDFGLEQFEVREGGSRDPECHAAAMRSLCLERDLDTQATGYVADHLQRVGSSTVLFAHPAGPHPLPSLVGPQGTRLRERPLVRRGSTRFA
jgi:hypothetical protein